MNRYMNAEGTIGVISSGAHTVVVEPGHPQWSEFVQSHPLAHVPPVPDLSLDDYRRAVQAQIDATAQARLYDNGNSLATYATSTNPDWAAEAQAFVAWRDIVWAQVYALWADPPNPPPGIAEVVTSLPEIVWP